MEVTACVPSVGEGHSSHWIQMRASKCLYSTSLTNKTSSHAPGRCPKKVTRTVLSPPQDWQSAPPTLGEEKRQGRYSICQVIRARIPTWMCLIQQNHFSGQKESQRSHRTLLSAECPNSVRKNLQIQHGVPLIGCWWVCSRHRVPWLISCEPARQHTHLVLCHLVDYFPRGYIGILLICYLAQVTSSYIRVSFGSPSSGWVY